MSLQYNTSRGCILPIGSLVCGLCRESHLKGIDLSHSKLITRKEDIVETDSAGQPSSVVTVTVMPSPAEVKPSSLPSPVARAPSKNAPPTAAGKAID